MVSTLDLDEVVARVLTNSVGYVGAERGMLIVLDAKQRPDMAAVYCNDKLIPSTHDTMCELLSDGLAGWVLREQKTVVIHDTSQDNRWLHRSDDEPSQSGPKSAVCAPLWLDGERLVGILTLVHSQPGFLNFHHAELLDAVADQAAIAIYNAQQYRSMETSQLHYQQLFEDNIDSVMITSWAGWILEANRMSASVTGYTISELTQRRITELHRPDWTALGEDYSMLRSGSQMVSFESELQCREAGRIIPVLVYAQKVVFNKEDCIQWVLRDISVRKELEALQSELLTMVYHDLRSPLSNVVSSLDMIRVMIPDELMANLEPLVNIALRSTDRVKRLADTLLDINHLEAGQKITDMKEVRIQRLVGEAIDTVQITADTRQHVILNEIPDGMPSIMVDEDMLRRVMINLLENAIKFTPPQGKIVIGGQQKGQLVFLWVDDTGPGIPLEARERIFDKFTRVNIENAPRGLGLGLAFCRLAVNAHGGKIWVEDRQPHGSRFIFSLPIDYNNQPR